MTTLPSLPDGWVWKRLRYLVEIITSNVDKHTKAAEHPVQLCNYVDVYNNDHVTDDLNFMEATATQDEIARFGLRRGDVVITKDSESPYDIGVPAYVEARSETLICGYHLTILRAKPDQVVGSYLAWALRSAPVIGQFRVRSQGVTRFGLSWYGQADARIPVPPSVNEQHRIATMLNERIGEIGRLFRMTGANPRSSAGLGRLLTEKRVALITTAVTGQLAQTAAAVRGAT